MRKKIKKYMPFLASGLVFGYNDTFSMPAFLYLVLLIVTILLVYVKPEYNITLYRKAVALLVGIFVGAIIGKPNFYLIETSKVLFFLWKALYCNVVAYLAAILMDSCITDIRNRFQDKNIKSKINWKDKNLFEVRKYDLERLTDMVFDQEVCSIGLEAEWGQGKSFLIDGLLEIFDTKAYRDDVEVDYVVIDVMAVRMDKFPEYIVGELENILYKNGRISGNLKQIKSLFKNAKIDILANILGDSADSYNKIFDDFREELLKLGRLVLIIYEDLDRLEDKKAISDILYLTEKLTSANDRVEYGGIKVIYQYDRQHMEHIGFSSRFLEKYIRRHMDLTVVDFGTMVKQLQIYLQSCDEWKHIPKGTWIQNDEIMKFSFIRSKIAYWFPEEKVWIDKYFSKGITLRRTKDFVASVLEKLTNENLNTKEKRECILVFYYIQYFMPFAYQRLKEAQIPAYPLWRVFSIPQKMGKEIYLMELAREIETKRQKYINSHDERINSYYQFVEAGFLKCIDYRKHPNEFELFIAFRLLFSSDNIISDEDKAWNRGTLDDFYSASSNEVYKRESLGYLKTEKMIRYLLQAGYEHTSEYVYWADIIVKDVLLFEDINLREQRFLHVLNQMGKNKRGIGTIQRMGTYLWPDIFRAFVFAGKTWSQQENERNFVKLIELYDYDRINGKSGEKMEYFSKKFINETLSLWEGLQDGNSLCKLAELVVRQKIYCNWNQYVNFYCYIKAVVRSLVANTYLFIDLWPLEDMEKEAREGHWDSCIELAKFNLDEVIRYLINNHQILLRYQDKGYLPGEDDRLRRLIALMEYFKNVMSHPEAGKEKTGPVVRTKIIDHMADACKEADAIEDDEEFKQYINNPANGVGIANSINLINKHERRRDSKT